jgi:hypothetical protein
MDVKEAVEIAKAHIQELFGSEKIYNLGLEEVSFDDVVKRWNVTIGFSRPWDEPANSMARFMTSPTRSYKVVQISDITGEIKSVKNRETNS